jgi:hypothetical protein
MIIHNAKCTECGSHEPLRPPGFATETFRNHLLSRFQRHHLFRHSLRPGVYGEPLGVCAGMIVFAASEKQVKSGAERGRVIGFPQGRIQGENIRVRSLRLETVVGKGKAAALRPVVSHGARPPGPECGLGFPFHVTGDFRSASNNPPIDFNRHAVMFDMPAVEGTPEFIADRLVMRGPTDSAS